MENTQETWPGRGVRGHSNSGELFCQTFCFGRGFCFLCQAIIHYLERGGRMERGEGTNTAGCQNSWPPNGITSKSGLSNLEARSGGEGGESRGTCWRPFCRLPGKCGKMMESLAVAEPGGRVSGQEAPLGSRCSCYQTKLESPCLTHSKANLLMPMVEKECTVFMAGLVPSKENGQLVLWRLEFPDGFQGMVFKGNI